jgi:trk system potassium uptake protein TrkH
MLLLRGMFIRHGLLLILSSCFHIILLFPQQHNPDIFGSEGILFFPFEYWLSGTLLLACAGFLIHSMLRMYQHAHGKDLSGISGLSDLFYFSILPLPLYLLTFPAHVFASLLGLGVCVIQGYYVALSGTDAKVRLQSRILRQSHREKKMELLVTPELLLLCLMALTGLFILLLLRLTKPFEQAGIQANMLLIYSLASFLLIFALELNLFRFLLRQAKDFADRQTGFSRCWCFHLLRTLPSSFWAAAIMLLLSLASLTQPGWRGFCYWGIFLHQFFGYLFLRSALGRPNLIWKWLLEHPGQMLISSFLVLIFCGAAFLNLPICSSTGESLGILNSLFTATSAVCVTGLSVLDIPEALSITGKVALIVLIQLGGLGIMSLSTFIAMLLGRKLGLLGNAAMRQSVGEEHSHQAKKILFVIVLGTFAIETAGAFLLTSFYQRTYGWDLLRSLGYGAFMSISAFCNAGVSLHPNSLMGFVQEPFILLVLSALLVTGGLGFAVLVHVFKWAFDRRKLPLGVYERVVLLTTLLIYCCGMLLFYIFEREALLSPLPFSDRLCNAWFQAASPRTAGFNSLDLTQLQSSSRVLLMLLMFIGGNSASTAGGVKVGTFALMCMTLRAWLKGQNRVVIGRRSISSGIIQQAITVILLTGGIVVGGTLLLAFLMPQAPLEDVIFEVVSAIGTVGLSTGLTGNLTVSGKWLIIFLMFLGRVGPVTFLLTLRTAKTGNIDYPPTRFLIG